MKLYPNVYMNEIVKTDKLLWNGPLGYFEKKPFDEGTAFVVKAVKNNKNINSTKLINLAKIRLVDRS